MNCRGSIASALLLVTLFGAGGSLAAWKYTTIQEANAGSAEQPEPMQTVALALSRDREYRPVTTSIGTFLALRSITLRNEEAGTVREVMLESGQEVETGTVLVALDVSVEEAELRAQQAQAALAQTMLNRFRRLGRTHAASDTEVDRALAERDVALAQIARIKAMIARKTIRAPFHAQVGLADVHPGQYLEQGTLLTTLQGVDDGYLAMHTAAEFARSFAAPEGSTRRP